MKISDLLRGSIYVDLKTGDKPRICFFVPGAILFYPCRAIDDLGNGAGMPIRATDENVNGIVEKRRVRIDKDTNPNQQLQTTQPHTQ